MYYFILLPDLIFIKYVDLDIKIIFLSLETWIKLLVSNKRIRFLIDGKRKVIINGFVSEVWFRAPKEIHLILITFILKKYCKNSYY